MIFFGFLKFPGPLCFSNLGGSYLFTRKYLLENVQLWADFTQNLAIELEFTLEYFFLELSREYDMYPLLRKYVCTMLFVRTKSNKRNFYLFIFHILM